MTRLHASVMAVVIATMLAAAASAAVPTTVNYQVMLTNDSDEPLSDTAVELVFHIYNQEVGGSPIWSETHNAMTNSIGVVSVVLGTSNGLNLPFNTDYWLEVVVDSETMTPRRELTAAPYARRADDSDHLGGVQASYYALSEDLYVPGVINTPSNPVDWTNLKNVPAGFADGTDNEGSGGSGDGHSLDADDGDPTDVVYVDAAGTVEIGGASTDGVVEVYEGGGSSPQIVLSADPRGGHAGLLEEDGEQHTFLEPDNSGTGGFLEIADGTYRAAFEVDGNAGTGGGARITMDGPVSTTIFEAWQAGDDAVQLPVDAISSPEIFDEPGVANASSNTLLPLDGPVQTLLSASIYCPTAGYVLAIGTVETELSHTNGTTSTAAFGISTTGLGYPTGGSFRSTVSAVAGTGTYRETVTCSWLYAPTAGVKTYYFVGSETSGDWDVSDRHFSLVFIPSHYGPVAAASLESLGDHSALEGAVAAPVTEADIAAQRAETEAAYHARIEAELAAMDAKIAKIRAEMGNGR